MEERLLTVKEAMSYLKIGRTTLYHLIKQGRIKPVKIGKRTLIDKEDLDRLIEESKGKVGEG